jgi:hypothetical protein
MHSDEIERRLRLPAHDEPSFLPPLLLPQTTEGFDLRSGRVRAGPAGGSLRLLSPRLVIALVALLAALAAATVTGAIRLDRLFNPLPADLFFSGDGVTLDYPDDWFKLTPEDPNGPGGAFTSLVVADRAVSGCSAADLSGERVGGNAVPAWATPNPGVVITPAPGESGDIVVEVPEPDGPTYSGIEDAIFACIVEAPMAPGEIRVALSLGAPQAIGIGPIESFDPTDWFGPEAELGGLAFANIPTVETGWTEVIDGMPAKLVVTQGSGADGPDEIRTWGIYDPKAFDFVWYVRAALRGPDLDALRAQADDIAKSLDFAQDAPALDTATRDDALADAIDGMDREERRAHDTTIFGCFPRAPGEQTVVLEDGPGGPLLEPVSVTCVTTVEETPLRMWHAELRMTWQAGDGYPAGAWGWELFFGADGSGGAQSKLGDDTNLIFPGTTSPAARPIDGALDLEPGSIVQMLAPGLRWDSTLVTDMYNTPHEVMGDRFVSEAQPGRRFVIVDGEPITYSDADWYLVEAPLGSSYPHLFQWLPVTRDGLQLVRVVDPECPAEPSVADLVRLLPAERVACSGDRPLTLEPVMATLEEDTGFAADGNPSWLIDAPWRLFGEAGPAGMDGSLPATIDPALVDGMEVGVPLSVTGHFADPTAATCEWREPADFAAEPPALQHLRCSEIFVVTAIEGRE